MQSGRIKSIPFDIPNVEFTHYGDQCTFGYIVKKYETKDRVKALIADIVSGADTDRHNTTKEAAGLWAVSAGI